MEPEGPAEAQAGPRGAAKQGRGWGAGDRRGFAETATACEASEATPAGKAVVGRAQRRVCRWETQICKGEASLRGRGASRPWRKAGVQGAGPRAPSAGRASTNLTQGGTCPGGPRAAVAPAPTPLQTDVWKSCSQRGTLLGNRVTQVRSVKGRRGPLEEGGPTGTVPSVLVGSRHWGSDTRGDGGQEGRRGLPEAGRGRKGHPQSLCRKPGLANTFISYLWPQNFETIAFCSFKSPVL